MKAFTFIELVISVGIIAILTAIAVPTITATYNNKKEEIVEIANKQTTIIVIRNGEVIETGTEVDLTKYTIISVDYRNGDVVVNVE